ncbi:MAG: hypothetical protein OHK0022_49860 [Roseiflexaceae bacterium]
MGTVDVTIVVEGSALLELGNGSQDPEHPQAIPSNTVYVFTSQTNGLSGHEATGLEISVDTGQDVQWQALGAALAASYTVAIYNIVSVQGDQIFATPQFDSGQVTTYYPAHGSAPLSFTAQSIYSPYWQTQVVQGGTGTYRFCFALLRAGSTTPAGYYSWDVQVTAPQPKPPRTIDVATIIDTAGMVQAGPGSQDPSKPAEVGGRYILMVNDRSNGLFGAIGGELWLAAAQTNLIRWQCTSLSQATGVTAVVYGIELSDTQTILAQPTLTVSNTNQPIPQPGHAPGWEFQSVPGYAWSAEVLSSGVVTCRFNCAVFDGQQQLKGYYAIRALIVIVTPEDQPSSADQQS